MQNFSLPHSATTGLETIEDDRFVLNKRKGVFPQDIVSFHNLLPFEAADEVWKRITEINGQQNCTKTRVK